MAKRAGLLHDIGKAVDHEVAGTHVEIGRRILQKFGASEEIVKAMQAKSLPVTYALFSDEGHGFARPENNIAFIALTESVLARHLGGRAEPIGDGFKGSSVTIPQGVDLVPGAKEALLPTAPPTAVK